MGQVAHHKADAARVKCAILTVSDSRTELSDSSGRTIRALLTQKGHEVSFYRIVPDDPSKIRQELLGIAEGRLAEVIIAHGGTGITSRDSTCEVAAGLIARGLPGFGEIFRMLSFQEVGAAAMLSRATAGVMKEGLALFVLPGSERAVELAVSRLILPELGHLVGLLRA